MNHDIKALRLAQSMSQKRLAFEAGIDVRTLRRIESGVAVSPESFRAVCIALKIDLGVPSGQSAQEDAPYDIAPVIRRFDSHLRKAIALSRRWSVRAVAAFGLVLACGLGVHHWWTRPNVSISIAFDRACEERGVYSRAFMAMDREFPDGYVVTDRTNGAKACEYRFEAYLNRTDSFRDDMSDLLRSLEHVGTKTTVSVISPPSEVVPRSKQSWDYIQRPSAWSVSQFAGYSFKKVLSLNHVDLQGDLAYGRGLFADQKSYDAYVESLQRSGNLSTMSEFGYVSSVSLPDESAFKARKAEDGIWTVKFPAQITYSNGRDLESCLNVTMRVKDMDGQLGVLNIIAAGRCPR